MLLDIKELERCSKSGFTPLTKDEMFYNVYKFAIRKVGEYNVIYRENYNSSVYDELESAAFLGVTKAINTYKEDKEVKFITYASKCIINELNLFMRAENRKNFNVMSIEKPTVTDEDGQTISMENILEYKVVNYFSEEDEESFNKLLYYVFTNSNTSEKKVVISRLAGVKYDDMLSIVGISRASSSKIMIRLKRKLKNRNEKFFYRNENTTFYPYMEFNKLHFKVSLETNELIKDLIEQKFLKCIENGYIIYQIPFNKDKVYRLLLDIINIIK